MSAQIEFEGQNISAGVERYRSSGASLFSDETQTLAISAPGARALATIMANLIPAIEEARQEAISGIGSNGVGHRPPQWWWFIAWLPADKLAHIVAHQALATPVREAWISGVRLLSLSSGIGAAVRDQIEYELWRLASRERAKDGECVDLARLLLHYKGGQIDQKTWTKWRRKIAEVERLDWTLDQRVHLGTKLLDLLLTHGSEWFELRLVMRRGRKNKMVCLTEAAKQALLEADGQMEASRPLRMPMLCPPLPWSRTHQHTNN